MAAQPHRPVVASQTEALSVANNPDETAAPAATAPKPDRRKPGNKAPWLFAGFAGVLTASLAAGVIIIWNKDGRETRIEVPDGATLSVQGKDRKTLAQVGPGGKQPAAAPDPERTAAEYSLSIGASVRANGENRYFKAAAELPKERFTLTALTLHGNTEVTDAGLAQLKDCKGLTALDVRKTQVTAKGLEAFHAALPGCRIEHAGGVIEPATAASDPDRTAAEYALSVGGSVRVNGEDRDLKAAAELPKEQFTLTWLNLNRSTKVTDAGLVHFKDCKGLTHLDLGGTKVTDAGLVHFEGCKALTGLYLWITAVTDAGLAHFKDCKGLTHLDLYYTKVTDAGLAHFKDCKGLTQLVLGETAVTDTGLAHFKDCKALTALNLGGTKVTDAGLAYFQDCKGLTFLYLGNAKVTDAGLAHFKDCKGLMHLGLDGTALTDAGLAYFQDCKGLTGLDVRKTQVTAKGLEGFHAAVPGCKIEHDDGVIEPQK